MVEIIHPTYVCEISNDTKLPVMDDKYFEKYSAYEKCKCINKIKSSLEILVKNKGQEYQAFFDVYKNKYSKNKCEDVFKNYIETNIKDIYSSVTKEDKERIESKSIKERNQRLYIAIGFFILVIGMVSIYKTRNNN
jgi:hypothetical protein